MLVLALLIGCSQDFGITHETREVFIEVEDTDSFVVEGFEQPPRVDELDIVVVLDKSCSMTNELPKARDAVVELFNQASSFIPDFRIMLMGISHDDYSEPIVLDSSALEIEVMTAFESIDDDAYEAAFQRLYNSHIVNNEPRYYRPTSIFVISDEPEDSNFTANLFVNYIDAVAYAPWEFNAIVPIVNDAAGGCVGGSLDYRQAADLTGGMSFDLCDESWDLFGGSQFSYEPITSFDVSLEPKEGSIEVYYDWTIVEGWTYSHPTITFSPEPPPGTNVTIAYEIE